MLYVFLEILYGCEHVLNMSGVLDVAREVSRTTGVGCVRWKGGEAVVEGDKCSYHRSSWKGLEQQVLGFPERCAV